MRRILLAIRVFFGTLFSGATARRVEQALSGPEPAEKPGPKAKQPASKPAAPKPPARSEALTLLAALQREARFVDFIKEPLDGYADAQIGAVVRDVHRDCAAVIERMFALKPILTDEEGARVTVPAGFETARYHLTGNVTGEPPYEGQMVHHGWKAAKCELPTWSGSPKAAKVVAAVEVELA